MLKEITSCVCGAGYLTVGGDFDGCRNTKGLEGIYESSHLHLNTLEQMSWFEKEMNGNIGMEIQAGGNPGCRGNGKGCFKLYGLAGAENGTCVFLFRT
jgi:hypothetical protein